MGGSMGAGETMFMMTRRNSDLILGLGIHFQAAAALYPICWRFNHVPDADFTDLVDAPIRIIVGDADDYDGGGDACKQLMAELAPADASHIQCVFSPVPRISSTVSLSRMNSLTHAPAGVKGVRCTTGQIRRLVGRRATILSHSFRLHCFLNSRAHGIVEPRDRV